MGCFHDGEEVLVEMDGEGEALAAQFFRITLENLEGYSDDPPKVHARLRKLIDEAFQRSMKAELITPGSAVLAMSSASTEAGPAEACRGVVAINDRLHNLSLPVLPFVAKHFGVGLEILFDLPEQGIFRFEMNESNQFQLNLDILALPVEIGTRITVLTTGAKRFAANMAVTNVLQNLWQCDEWIRNQAKGLESSAVINDLLAFAETLQQQRSPEYTSVQNPYISNLVPFHHVFVNDEKSDFSKDEMFIQLAAPHVLRYRLESQVIVQRIKDADAKEQVLLRPGFALAHGTVERAPRISISFGLYPKGITWDAQERIVKLVCLVVVAKDAYGTWRDCLRKLGILFRTHPGLQEQLLASESSRAFCSALQAAETSMMT